MNLLGLSPWAYAAGLAGFAGTLFVLHMLRVRLRRQRVDSLLFFRQVGAVHKPRVLLGLPARWWSFLLGLALLGAAFTTFADPVDAGDGPSRVVLVDATSGVDPVTRDALGRAAAEIADTAGLGARGSIIAFGEAPTTLLGTHEPRGQLAERLGSLPTGGAPSTFWEGLEAAAAALRPGDEIVVLGGPPLIPEHAADIPVVRGGFAGRGGITVVAAAVEHGPDGRRIRVEASTEGRPGEVLVRDGTDVVDRVPLQTARGASLSVRLGPIDERAHPGLVVEVAVADSVAASVPFPLGPLQPARVHIAPGVAACVHAVVEAAPQLVTADSELDADVLVLATPLADSTDRNTPCLVLAAGAGSALRQPRATTANPLPLSLRDRQRTGAVLPAGEGEVWVEDATSGAALVRRTPHGVEAVDWLLDDPTHRDVPALVCGALLALAPGSSAPAWQSALPPIVPADSTELALAGLEGPFPWAAVLLACALAALLVDGWLHHRGRVA
ncbi:MAG: hypothetical protein ACO3RU_00320 [Planctomycetota bacterium]